MEHASDFFEFPTSVTPQSLIWTGRSSFSRRIRMCWWWTSCATPPEVFVAPTFGYRTMGAGGSPVGEYAGVYSEGVTYVTRSLIVRSQPVVTSDYPTTRYIENVGVRPDTVVDYMTVDNLVNKGAAFVAAFTDAAVKLAKG